MEMWKVNVKNAIENFWWKKRGVSNSSWLEEISGKYAFWKQGYVNSIIENEQILTEMHTMDWEREGKADVWNRMKRGISISQDSYATNDKTQLSGFRRKGNLLAWRLEKSNLWCRHLDPETYIMSPDSGWLPHLLALLSLAGHHFHSRSVSPRVSCNKLMLVPEQPELTKRFFQP